MQCWMCHKMTSAERAWQLRALEHVACVYIPSTVMQLINPCNSTLHPAVREAKIKPEGVICCLPLVCTSSRSLQGLCAVTDAV